MDCLQNLQMISQHLENLLQGKNPQSEVEQAFFHLKNHEGICSWCWSVINGANQQIKELIEKMRNA